MKYPKIVKLIKQFLHLIKHEFYGGEGDFNTDNDIALIVLEETVVFSQYVQPVCLPTNNNGENDYFPSVDTTVYAVGWGDTREQTEASEDNTEENSELSDNEEYSLISANEEKSIEKQSSYPNELQMVQLNVYDSSFCNNETKNRKLSVAQICAGKIQKKINKV